MFFNVHILGFPFIFISKKGHQSFQFSPDRDRMATASSVFASLDAPFINFNKEVEPIVWQGKDILVQQTFELKIPAMCGATIKYSFTTEIGDISFSTEYNTPGQPLEILVESLRVPSDEEKIEGSFKAGRDGTFCMIFDNSYSWFNPKLLTYKVSLYQVVISLSYHSFHF